MRLTDAIKPGPIRADASVRADTRISRKAANLSASAPLHPDDLERLDNAIAKICNHLLSLQNTQGYWVFACEADATIPAEYILLQRFLGRKTTPGLPQKLTNYLRRRQLADGGWPLYTGGAADLSASVKAYFALKVAGDSADAPHMEAARQCILGLGGAAKANVFTRITLAMFGQIPWRITPAMPVEIMILPERFFFHLNKVSYWSRTVIVPLLILYAKRPICRLRPAESVAELFKENPLALKQLDGRVRGNYQKNLFILLDRLLKRIEPFIPCTIRAKALRRAERWTRGHMQGEGGIGAIFPAMANAVMALRLLGYPDDHPDMVRGLKALDDLIIAGDEEAFCQPCQSPVWDTCLTLSALSEAGFSPEHPSVVSSTDWLLSQQIFTPGDWTSKAPKLLPGAWAFQFENRFYPDLDDTAMVLMALLRAGYAEHEAHRKRLALAANWVVGMQNADGGWGAFDIDNNAGYLNNIPFADHGALLDPSTSDLTARCIEMLAVLGYRRDFPPIAKGLAFLRRQQEKSGAWFGRWGVNYIYGTWSVLVALRLVDEEMSQAYIRRAVAWLNGSQNADGGWGETCNSYDEPCLAGCGASTASQTAWAMLGLMAAGEVDSPSVRKGLDYLMATQNARGLWDEPQFTGTGFPRVFYLRYHGYRQYFPLWALGVYRRLQSRNKMRHEEVKLSYSTLLPLSIAP